MRHVEDETCEAYVRASGSSVQILTGYIYSGLWLYTARRS
jgi:hypothetical protein